VKEQEEEIVVGWIVVIVLEKEEGACGASGGPGRRFVRKDAISVVVAVSCAQYFID
jgi:hypothetical protein